MRYSLLILLVGAAAGLACEEVAAPPGPEPITELPRDLTAAERNVVESSNAFAFELLHAVRAARPDSPNTFLSPLSASMALGMTMNGAEGTTWTQMRDALGFQGLDEATINEAYRSLIELLLELDPSVEVGLGNAIWVDELDLLDGFVERTESYFHAEVDRLDFDDPTSADVMNGWVDSVTRGRIDRLVESVDPDALLYLVNAIYFNGDWRTTFDKDRTTAATFTRSDGARITVQMMADEVGYRFLNPGDPTAVQGVELPYGGDAYAAVALLPPADESIDTFIAGIAPADWAAWMAHFDAQATEEDLEREGLLVRLPKFELEWGDSLNGPLRVLGMTHAFDERADFRRIAEGGQDLEIYTVQQKTYVRVDEEGTEAAAATSVVIGPTSAPPSVAFDRPFLFAIRERLSGTILFMGVIGDPSV